MVYREKMQREKHMSLFWQYKAFRVGERLSAMSGQRTNFSSSDLILPSINPDQNPEDSLSV